MKNARVMIVPACVVVAGTLLGATLGMQPNTSSPGSMSSALDASSPNDLSDTQALRYVMNHLKARRDSVDSEWVQTKFAEMLPNQKFRLNGSRPQRLSAGVVVGTITEINPGAGYAIAGSDADNGTVVPYDSTEALWRVAELTVTISDNFGVHAPDGRVRVGLPFNGTADRAAMEAGLAGRQVVLALDAPGFFSHNEDLYAIAHSGALLGLVSGGVITLPVMGDDAKPFLNGVDDLGKLRREAAKTKNVVSVDS